MVDWNAPDRYVWGSFESGGRSRSCWILRLLSVARVHAMETPRTLSYCTPWRRSARTRRDEARGGEFGGGGAGLGAEQGEAGHARCRAIQRTHATRRAAAGDAIHQHLTAHRTLYDMQYRDNPDPKRLTAGVRLALTAV